MPDYIFILISGLLKMCLGFPHNILVHLLISFHFEGYAKAIYNW